MLPLVRPVAAAALALMAACAQPDPAADALARAGSTAAAGGAGDADGFLIVDCLLPGQIRGIGQQFTYVARSRAIRTSVSDCQIRGGEYVVSDRANYQTALKVWQPLAEQGDAKAQTHVGEIYEKGLGTAPDYALAAQWYRKAAAQGHAPAQIYLGLLYERGLGVPKDMSQALAWYRKATGVGDLQVAAAPAERRPAEPSAEQKRLEAEARQLRERLQTLEAQLAAAQKKIDDLQKPQPQAPRPDEAAAREELERLRRDRQKLETETAQLKAELEKRTREGSGTPAPGPAPAPEVSLAGIPFGNYHALVIGNNDYRHLPALKTAVADARSIGELLRSKYGFQVTTLVNAGRYDILSALNRLRGQLTDNDNLLLYYAGHGTIDQATQRGYWQPVDAESGNNANWISTFDVTDILQAMTAKHVLVVADSCYSGALTRSALARLEAGQSPKARRAWIEAAVQQRSRTALTSGGLEPVLDASGGANSLFATALIKVLNESKGVLDAQSLSRDVATAVTYAARAFRFQQKPEYAPIEYADHGGGEFFLVAGGGLAFRRLEEPAAGVLAGLGPRH
jgi:uncharacterized caspase-like protein